MSLRLRERIMEAVRRYNEYRQPEAVAQVVGEKENRIYVLFTGRFCHTCGVVDWIEDLAYEMREQGVKARLVEVLEPEDESEDFRIGVFEIEGEEVSEES